MNRLTKQEVFDKVWDWFVLQDKPRAMFGDGCVYRGEDNACCAIGLFIPDDLYTDELEDNSVQTLFIGGISDHPAAEYLRELLPDDVSFLQELQDCHDSSYDVRGNLENLAFKWDLKVPE